MKVSQVDTENSSLYTLQLPSKLNSLTAVENFIEVLKTRYNISEKIYAAMLTSLSEAAINAIVHGNREDESKKINITLEVQNNHLIFTVSDEGKGFDYSNLPDPTAPENLENLTGRGIFIIRKLADKCLFNSSGNKIELHFNI
jgi:serine/threonine-protein kinase RsbW